MRQRLKLQTQISQWAEFWKAQTGGLVGAGSTPFLPCTCHHLREPSTILYNIVISLFHFKRNVHKICVSSLCEKLAVSVLIAFLSLWIYFFFSLTEIRCDDPIQEKLGCSKSREKGKMKLFSLSLCGYNTLSLLAIGDFHSSFLVKTLIILPVTWPAAGTLQGKSMCTTCLFTRLFADLIQLCQYASWPRFRRTVIHLGTRSREAWLRQAVRTVMWLNHIPFQGAYTSWVSSYKWVKVKDAADPPGWIILLHVTFIFWSSADHVYSCSEFAAVYIYQNKPVLHFAFTI